MDLADFIHRLKKLATDVVNLQTAYQEEQLLWRQLRGSSHHVERLGASLAQAYRLLDAYISDGDLEALRRLRGLVKAGL